MSITHQSVNVGNALKTRDTLRTPSGEGGKLLLAAHGGVVGWLRTPPAYIYGCTDCESNPHRPHLMRFSHIILRQRCYYDKDAIYTTIQTHLLTYIWTLHILLRVDVSCMWEIVWVALSILQCALPSPPSFWNKKTPMQVTPSFIFPMRNDFYALFFYIHTLDLFHASECRYQKE